MNIRKSCWQDEDECQEEGERPARAYASLCGGPLAPKLRGEVRFEDCGDGVWVSVEVCGLPPFRPAKGNRPQIGPHGFHLHETGCCEVGDPADPFLAAGSHWNPDRQPHGNHAGDFPALFSNHGLAVMSFYTDRFFVEDIIGKAVVIHQSPDDYQTQPSGNSGKRIACGVVKRCR